jgi:hypothetical protein
LPLMHLDICGEKHHDVSMRTTLTVDDDLTERLIELARETRQPFKVVLNAALRRGLGELSSAAAPFSYRAHPGRLRAGIDDRRLNELVWELDEDRFWRAGG